MKSSTTLPVIPQEPVKLIIVYDNNPPEFLKVNKTDTTDKAVQKCFAEFLAY